MKCELGLELTVKEMGLTPIGCKCNNNTMSGCGDPSIKFSNHSGKIFTEFVHKSTKGNYKNPFDSSKNGFAINWSVPNVDMLGITHCNINPDPNNAVFNGIKYATNKDILQCHTRWGSGKNDYISSFIKNPYK